MSGHSKWHNIQGRKGKQDALRGNLFSKLSKAISVTARQGGVDPVMNFSLRLVVDKAKAAGMPRDNIERAIKKGAGELKDGTQVDQLLYEAYGPGGVAILIKGNTDNKNRTVQEIKHILSNAGGSLGSSGSVQWMFQLWGVVVLNKEQLAIANLNRDDFDMRMIETGAEDIQNEDEEIIIKTKVDNLQKLLGKIKEMNLEPVSFGMDWVAKDKIKVSPEVAGRLEKLFDQLEEHDDVEDYYTNAE